METLLRDLSFALRMLRRTPGVAAAAVLALALGIGANSAIFSVVDGVLLRPLPYRDSHQLYRLHGNFTAQGLTHIPLSYAEYKDLGTLSRTLASVAVYTQGDSNLSGVGGAPDRVHAGLASATLFPLLGVQPILGRGFSADDEVKGRDDVAVIDWGLWQRRFGGDPDAVGKSLQLDGQAYRIVGVLPRGFQLDGPCDLWIPLSTSFDYLFESRGSHWLAGLGRIKPGLTEVQLRSDLEAVTARQHEQFPKNYRQGTGWKMTAQSLLDSVVGDARTALWVLLGAVGFVLLIACANVANLMLARATARHKEMAIRSALGAGRARLVRQLVTESLLLSLVGGGLGLLLAVWGIDGLVALGPDAVPRISEIGAVGLDGRVVAFTLLVSLLTGVAFGLMPALAASRPDLNAGLKDGARGSSSRGRLRRALVVTEVALSMVLLVGAGLMVRSFLRLRDVDPGFISDRMLTLTVSLPTPSGKPAEADRVRYAAYHRRATERLAELPGVTAAGAVNILPLSGNSSDFSFEIENYVPRNEGDRPDNEVREVTPGYFGAMSIPLLTGRVFSASDDLQAPRVVVINRAMARRYWSEGTNPIGRRIRLDRNKKDDMGWATMIGVVGDVRGFGLDAPARAEMYFPHAQLRRSPAMTMVLKTSGDPAALAGTARAALAEIDATQPVFDVRPMNNVIKSSLAPRRFALLLMLLFAAVALVLAAVGIYGVMAYTVAQRTQEIGIRVALGASPGDVLGMVLRDGMLLVALGLGVGLLAALALTRLVSSLLYGVSASDLGTYGAIAAALAAVALLAILIPARRATRVEPMLALRSE